MNGWNPPSLKLRRGFNPGELIKNNAFMIERNTAALVILAKALMEGHLPFVITLITETNKALVSWAKNRV